MAKILITGSAGFIGTHLARHLKGHEVVGYDAVNGDFCQDFKRLALAASGCEFVYHLASTVGVQNVLNSPSGCISNNLDALRSVLKLCLPGIYASSSEVYGMTSGEHSEDSPMTMSGKPRWAYAASKLAGEYYAREAGWGSVRFFNVVGPGQNKAYGAVLPRFVEQAQSGETLTLYGDGLQIRTFLDVHDCVEILDRLREKKFDVTNIGSYNTHSIYGLALCVRRTLKSASKIECVPYPFENTEFDECRDRVPDLRRMLSLVGKMDFTPLNKTIQEMSHVQTRTPEATLV